MEMKSRTLDASGRDGYVLKRGYARFAIHTLYAPNKVLFVALRFLRRCWKIFIRVGQVQLVILFRKILVQNANKLLLGVMLVQLRLYLAGRLRPFATPSLFSENRKYVHLQIVAAKIAKEKKLCSLLFIIIIIFALVLVNF